MAEPSPSVRLLVGLAILAVVATALVGGLWSALLVADLALSPDAPWSVAVMAVVLAGMWRLLGGRWGPRAGRAERARMLRAQKRDREADMLGALCVAKGGDAGV